MTTTNDVIVHKNNRATPVKFTEYEEFILWYATPYTVKKKMGIETQKEFAAFYNLNEHTLSKWKERKEFTSRVRKLRDQWAFEKTMDVIQSIYQSSLKGNPHSQKLWMQVFEDFKEKSDVTNTEKVELSENDFRFIIDGLPEPMRSKYHGYITEIIVSANSVAGARSGDDVEWNATRPEDTVFDEADQDARNVPDTGKDAVAVRYSERVCENLERCVSENNYKSASRGR